MRWLALLFLAVCIGLGTWWLYHNNHQVRDLFNRYFDKHEISTLEARYRPEEIAQANHQLLQPTKNHELEQAKLSFYPYLSLNVAYITPDHSSGRAKLLWGMHDGEIVTNTNPWETSRGFGDCLNAEAGREDFRIINALVNSGGALSKEELAEKLQVNGELLDSWIAKARQKHLILAKGDYFYLHFLDPKLDVYPQTKISESFEIKPYLHADKAAKRFEKGQIENTAKAAFGNDFEIISSEEIYLPIYTFITRNPDGTAQTTYWNSLNGQQIRSR